MAGKARTTDTCPPKGWGLTDAKRINWKPPGEPGIDVPGHDRTTVGQGGVRGGETCDFAEVFAVLCLILGLTRLVITNLVTVSPFW